jgi:hypothetical protein
MIKLMIGYIAGILTVVLYPEVLTWFVTSGMRDQLIERLQSI